MLQKIFRMHWVLDAIFDDEWFNFGLPESTHYDENAIRESLMA